VARSFLFRGRLTAAPPPLHLLRSRCFRLALVSQLLPVFGLHQVLRDEFDFPVDELTYCASPQLRPLILLARGQNPVQDVLPRLSAYVRAFEPSFCDLLANRGRVVVQHLETNAFCGPECQPVGEGVTLLHPV
jgi:hypothetical protein